MDLLTDIISRLKIKSQKIVIFDMKKNTKISFPEYCGMKIYIAQSGTFFFKSNSNDKTHLINEGDVVIISNGSKFNIFDNPEAKPTDISELHIKKEYGSYFTNGDKHFSFVGCRFTLQINDTFRIITSLPDPLIIRPQRSENEEIKDLLRHLSKEISNTAPGGKLIIEHLLQIILTQVLRILISSEHSLNDEGWFYAMADKNIGRALMSIHSKPGEKWNIDTLANIAGMSRTAFTIKFRKLLGYSVNEYIRRWRFSLAIERMANDKEKISQIAYDLGYGSESAFSSAFKKCMGQSPKNYLINFIRES
ncbi:helix-turn-helix transcriptional regulator [Enterobacter ludwigii]|nr:helix-turn-helix transcriptional regulator [Enterobacter ludwigii]